MSMLLSIRDLEWSLDKIKRRERAINFFDSVHKNMCVYSQQVEQLYTSYDLHVPHDDSRSVVILPDPYKPHDTVNSLGGKWIRGTGILIIPGSLIHKEGLAMAIPRSKNGKRRHYIYTLQDGLNIVRRIYQAHSWEFNPIVTKGDLREVRHSTPCLHVHNLSLEHTPELSSITVQSIRQVVQDRIHDLARREVEYAY